MTVRRCAVGQLVLSAGFVAMLAGCAATPMGPTVAAMAGPGKSFDTFQADNASCKVYAAGQVQGQADAANQRAAGTVAVTTLLGAGLGAAVGGAAGDAASGAAIGAATGAGTGAAMGAEGGANDQAMIQQQYDNAYAQCMYAKGEQVPGFAPAVAAAPPVAHVAVADPLVRSTQAELIRLGYLHDTADGFIGPKTRSAIAGFESAHDMTPDGTPSTMLLARMQSTPTSATASAAPTASAPSGWVAPTTAGATPASTPAAPSGWVAPTKQ